MSLDKYVSKLKSTLKTHPLQQKRIDLESFYREQRKKLEVDFKEQMSAIQDECTHHWEDGTSALNCTSPPFCDTYCQICNKFDFSG